MNPSGLQRTPFTRILIANRGEIALRIMRTARRLGYEVVAIYSDADRDARHTREADSAIRVGGSAPAESYSNIERIVAAAQQTKADAIHPGYGFLAENAQFAAACATAGLVFIGPSAAAIDAMGSKAAAKNLMLKAGIQCVPGYQGETQDLPALMKAAATIGFPVMIKATAGGGGRGIRLVNSAAEFPAALRSAQSEAANSFGDSSVILEKAIIAPRHVEVQVFADRYGSVLHFGERDCSVQRRHQKVIEEAPSPVVDEVLRARLGASAVAAVKAIAYEGAGTIEYLLDAARNFYFMEMNTRLQVEHPVTEIITGVDLVELQLRVAAGEPLPMKQQEIQFHGHAIEVRLCSEDPENAFMPQSGSLHVWKPPVGVRVEHALESGSPISPYYDSMIAKVIGAGDTRDDARRQLAYALDHLVALGVKTNQAFLARCLRHPLFASGQATTAFIAAELPSLLAQGADLPSHAAAAALLLFIGAGSSESLLAPTNLSSPLPVSMQLELDGNPHTAKISNVAPGRYAVELAERKHPFELLAFDDHRLRLSCDGVDESVDIWRADNRCWFRMGGVTHVATDKRFVPATRGAAARDGTIRASMSGRVVGLHASVGDIVAAGAPIVTLEAMQMEHLHLAPIAGRLSSLKVILQEQVSAHGLLAEIERKEGTPP